MPPTPTTSDPTASRLALQDAAADELEANLDAYGETLATRIRRMLDGQPVGDLPAERALAGLSTPDQVRAAVLSLRADDLEDITAEELEPASEAWFTHYSTIASNAEVIVGALGVPDASTLLDGELAMAEVDALVARHDDALFGGIQRASAGRVLEALHGGITDLTHAELAARIRDAEGASIPVAMTEAQTRIAEADRAFVDLAVQAAEGRDAGLIFMWAYAGPADGRTRPFCAHLVGKVFTAAQISRLRNGQTSVHPRHAGGGFRCRHTLVPVLIAGGIDDLPYVLGTDADIAAANAAAVRTRRRRRPR